MKTAARPTPAEWQSGVADNKDNNSDAPETFDFHPLDRQHSLCTVHKHCYHCIYIASALKKRNTPLN